MAPALETQLLSKQFGSTVAVDCLSLRVERGEIYAFLGLNGAGKTTTIRMLLGMIRPTSGEARVLGMDVAGRGVKPWASVGYLVETADAYPELSVRENLDAVRRLRPGTRVQAVAQTIERLGLTSYADRPAGTLSHGNKQRLGVAKALLHQPDLLILDEPANGLDPAGIVEMRALLTSLARGQGVTIFMSSHILSEVARLAHRIGIIHRGQLLQELDVAELERNRRSRLLVTTRDSRAACSFLESAVYAVSMNGDAVVAVTDDEAIDRPDKVATLLVTAGLPPTMLLTQHEELEQYFLRVVGVSG